MRQVAILDTPVVELCGTFKLLPQEFREAFDPATGREVWSWRGQNPMVASLLTTAGGLVFAGEPRHYIALPVGWGGWVEGYAPEMYGAPRGTSLMVFALP